MVAQAAAVASNQRLATAFPQGLVAVFVGGTSGVGEYTLKALVEHVPNSRAYIIGRSQESATRIIGECKSLGPSCYVQFIKADISLIKSVDDVCRQIKEKETAINILFETQGSMAFSRKTEEGLAFTSALGTHGRVRFILNLLPLLQRATTLRRVVSVFAATCEGPVDLANFDGDGWPLMKRRDQFASFQTLLLEKIAASKAPDVGFVHDVPGVVQSGITRDAEGFNMKLFIAVSNLLGPLIRTPPRDCGEMHLFMATSARYVSRQGGVSQKVEGVPLPAGVSVARGSDGRAGSGVYSLNNKGESSPPRVETLLQGLRDDGTTDKVWARVARDLTRITGREASV